MDVPLRHTHADRWYREPWPWILMAGPVIVVFAGFATLWIAISSSDGLVADDYYKQGLAINQTLTRTDLARRLGLRATVDVGSSAVVRVSLTGSGVLPAGLRLTFVHPTRALADQAIELRIVAPGIYEGPITTPLAGRRVLTLEDVSRTWRLSGEARGEITSLILEPQG